MSGLLDPPTAAAPVQRRSYGLLDDMPERDGPSLRNATPIDPLVRHPILGLVTQSEADRLTQQAEIFGMGMAGGGSGRVRTRTPMRGNTDPNLNADYNRYLEGYRPPAPLTDAQRAQLGVDPARVQQRIDAASMPRYATPDIPPGMPADYPEMLHYGTTSSQMIGNAPVGARDLNDYMRWYRNQRDGILPGSQARYDAETAAQRVAREAAIPRAERGSRAYQVTDELRGRLVDLGPNDAAMRDDIVRQMQERYREMLQQFGPDAFKR